MQVNVSFALLLTTLDGLSTGIGSVIAYFIRKPNYSYLAVILGFSVGVMVYISFAELLKTSVEEVGFATPFHFLTPTVLSTLLAFIACLREV